MYIYKRSNSWTCPNSTAPTTEFTYSVSYKVPGESWELLGLQFKAYITTSRLEMLQ